MDVMLDIETLATPPDSVILTLGAVRFDPKDADGDIKGSFYKRLDVDEQLKMGRRVDEETVAWWGKQAPQVREEALGTDGRTPCNTVFDELSKFLDFKALICLPFNTILPKTLCFRSKYVVGLYVIKN